MHPTTVLHYCALAAYGLAAVLFVVGAIRRRGRASVVATVGLGAASALNLALLVSRGIEAAHAPFQTNYEALALTALCLAVGYVLVFVTNHLHRVGAYGQMITCLVGLLTALLTAGVLVAGLMMADHPRELPPALQSPWFVPHVIVYIFGYGTLGVAFCASVVYLALKALKRLDDEAAMESGLGSVDTFAYRVIGVGFPFLSAGLIFGAFWAQEVWATYWGWDSKEVWSLITWLVYLIYLHLRRVSGWRGTRSAWFVIVGAIAIVITFQLFGYLPASTTSVHKY